MKFNSLPPILVLITLSNPELINLMSAFDGEISNVGASNRQGFQGGDGNGDGDDGGNAMRDEDGKKKHTIGKAKQVFLQQFTKAKRELHNRRHRKALRSSSGSSGAAIVTRASGKTIRGGSIAGCYFCFSRPQVLESPSRSPPSDPNTPSFTYAMFKTLIEKNDFYSKECNPHID